MLLLWHPVLPNDLGATEFRHASCPLVCLFEQDTKELSKAWNVTLILFIVASPDRRQTPQKRRLNLLASVSSMNDAGRFGSSVRPLMRLDSSLNIIEFPVFFRSSRIDFVCEPFLNFPTACWILPTRSSSFKISSFGIPSNLRLTLNSGSFFNS